MLSIDVTITATMRISIFSKTINSFFQYLFEEYLEGGNKLNLILNIDPIGHDGKVEDFVGCIRGKFHDILIHTPLDPSFPKAFKFVWKNSTSDYVFHLEDDWELLKNVHLLTMINVLEEEKDLASLRLSAFYAGRDVMKNWNKFFPYNGTYYDCPEELRGGLGFCGHPSLIKGEFVRNTAKFLDEDRNPEKQFHNKGRTKIMEEVFKWRYGVYSIPNSPPLIRDLGRSWMVENGYRKVGTKAFFTHWENPDGGY